jgi:hypothetical protein
MYKPAMISVFTLVLGMQTFFLYSQNRPGGNCYAPRGNATGGCQSGNCAAPNQNSGYYQYPNGNYNNYQQNYDYNNCQQKQNNYDYCQPSCKCRAEPPLEDQDHNVAPLTPAPDH